MSTVEVILDAHKLLGFLSIPDYAEAALEDVMGTYISRIQRRAKILHRFRNRTGNLVSAIESEVYGLSGRVYIDDMLAPYGKFVHNGQRTWAPDPFIYDAVAELEDELTTSLKKTLEKTIEKNNIEVSIEEPSVHIVYTIEPTPIPMSIKPIPVPVKPTPISVPIVEPVLIKPVPIPIRPVLVPVLIKPVAIPVKPVAIPVKPVSVELKTAIKTVNKAASKNSDSYNSLALLFAFMINEEDAALAKEALRKKQEKLKRQEMYR